MPSPRILPILLAFPLVAALLGACSGTPVATRSPGVQASGNFAAALESLTVAQERPMTKYSRDRFPHWRSAGSNCDVRDTVLARDGKNLKKTGCNVTGGEWYSVYDKQTLTDPLDVDVDHMVPLANAWRSGADVWDDQKRSDFANDLERPQLIAVSKSSNRSKGDQNPAQWTPPNKEYFCQYAQAWITVKSHWKLTITTAEKRALGSMLGTCV